MEYICFTPCIGSVIASHGHVIRIHGHVIRIHGHVIRILWCCVTLYTGMNVNECATNNGGCAHTCMDTVGSFTCSCRSGFVLASNGLDCNGEEGREGRETGRREGGREESEGKGRERTREGRDRVSIGLREQGREGGREREKREEGRMASEMGEELRM